MVRRRPKRKKPEEPVWYRLWITGWEAGYVVNSRVKTSGKGERAESETRVFEHLGLELDVEFETPQKGVSAGSIEVCFSESSRGRSRRDDLIGGELNLNNGEHLTGILYVGWMGVHALMMLLSAEKPIALDLKGDRFRYRHARISVVSWYTKGHPEVVATGGCDSLSAQRISKSAAGHVNMGPGMKF